MTSTNLRAEEDGMRVLAASSTLTATLRLCRVKLTRVQKFSPSVEKQKPGSHLSRSTVSANMV